VCVCVCVAKEESSRKSIVNFKSFFSFFTFSS
jgi:hypothetical protein